MSKYSKTFLAAALLASSATMALADGYKYSDAGVRHGHAQLVRTGSMAARAYAHQAAPKTVKPFTVEEQRMFDRASVVF